LGYNQRVFSSKFIPFKETPLKNETSLRYPYLVWDVDGTLFDTYPELSHAMHQALADLGCDLPFERVDALARQSLDLSLQTWSGECDLQPDDIRAHFRQHYYAITPESQPPFPGVGNTCVLVCDRGGGNFIFTHRRRKTLSKLLEAYQMAAYFRDMVTSDDDYPRKPDPAGLLAIMERNHLPPDQVLMIGDREIDILAGKNAGVTACLFGSNSSDTRADVCFTDFRDFSRWLEGR
jgi:HAD superfamily hydrolase (TIGR01509 family)